uniref:probable G-protein coupled receptor 82 n=1 Tax=Solea senegalensis TaxID=28829 RepID=UPI001CD8C003|nr:probable G-protein coupled receptor 82 [Solea senegalensis]
MDFPPVNTSVSSSLLSLCPSVATRLLLPSAYALLFVTALPGNALSLWVFLRRIATMSPTHVYLCHLSVSNLLLSTTAPFLAAYYARGWAWTLHGVLCQLVLHGVTPVLHINVYISIMILTWVALSRFAALIRHTHADRPSACATLLPRAFFTRLTEAAFASRVCVTVWAVAVGGVVPVTVYYSVNEGRSGERAECAEVCYNPVLEIGGSVSSMMVVPVSVFFVCYLLVMLSYMTVLSHIRRSRRSTHVTTSKRLLSRVLRNIVVIQVVLSVCLLPYHIFRPIFMSVTHHQDPPTFSPSASICDDCHPMSVLVEVKNALFLLALLRGSTDPVMYVLLDKIFRHQTFKLLRCNWGNSGGDNDGKPARCLVTGSAGLWSDQQVEGTIATATGDLSQGSFL